MARTEIWFKQDLQGAVCTQYILGNFFSMDNVGNLVGVRVYNGEAEETLTGSVTGYCILKDGTTVSVAGTRSGNTAYIILPQSALAIPGEIGIVIKLIDGSTITTLLSIAATVYRSKTDEVITPSSQIITDWSNQIAAALQEVEDASAAQDEKIDSLKGAIDPVIDISLGTWTDGYYLHYTGSQGVITVANANYSVTDYIFIPAGVSVKVRTYMSALAKLIAFDANKNYITNYMNTSGVSYGEFNLDITAENADRYIRFTCYQPKKNMAFVNVTNSMEIIANITNILNRLAVSGYGSRISSSATLTSLADALPNTVYTFTTKVEDSQPADSGTMLTLNCTKDNNGGHAQIFITSDNEILTRIKWSRSGGVAFSAWAKLSNAVETYDYADLTMCKRIGIIGDSFASGVIYPSDYVSGSEANYTHYDQSWGQCLARLCGNTVVNYSAGGMTTRSWLTNQTYGKGKFDADTACDLYILCLGINDSNTSMGDYLGTVADIESGADTFYGNYGKIIKAIKAKSATARIVMSTYCRIPTTGTSANYNAFNEAIQNIAEAFSIPCIVLTDDDFFNSRFYLNGMQNSHPTAPQYSGYAKAVNRLIAKNMVNNYSYWSNYSSQPVS